MGYNIYIAKIVGVSNEGDDRLQVRILPQMDDSNIPDGKCPLWPYFFKNETFTGKINELVWCICNDDFSAGYILGIVNYTTPVENDYTSGKVNESDTKETNFSIPKDLRNNVSNFIIKLTGTSLSYNDVRVTYWSDTCIHLVERSSGGIVIAYSTGTVYIMRPELCLFSVGDSIFKMDSDGIHMKGNSIELQSKNVRLGNNPHRKVAVSLSSSGVATIASDYVKA